MTFKPSIYQQNVFNFIQSGSGNGVIKAVAGAGKTTTIIQSLSLIPTNKRILMLAFNKNIANELKEEVPYHVEVSTFHACGFASLRNSSRARIQVKGNKVFPRSLSASLTSFQSSSYLCLIIGTLFCASGILQAKL